MGKLNIEMSDDGEVKLFVDGMELAKVFEDRTSLISSIALNASGDGNPFPEVTQAEIVFENFFGGLFEARHSEIIKSLAQTVKALKPFPVRVSLRWGLGLESNDVNEEEYLNKYGKMLGLADSTEEGYMEEEKTQNIAFTDFLKVDLRTGTIRAAEKVAKSDKLLKLQIDFGPLGQRQIVAGIAKYFEPENLKNMRVVAVVNLQPRKLMGLESHGMILAVGGEDTLNLITTSYNDVLDGSRIG